MTISRKSGAPKRFNGTDILVQILLFSLGFLISMPIFIAFFTSFKPPAQVVSFPPVLIPREWTFENYVTAWNKTPFGRYLLNSIIQSGIIMTAQVLFSVLAAYAFSILKFPGRDIVFYVVLGSLMIPFELVFIPNFQLISSWGLANTYAGLTAPFLVSAFGVFMLRQFFVTVPTEYYDSARIDGANNWRFLWRILVPLSKGSIGAFAIFAFLSAWNQYLWPLIITNSDKSRPLTAGLVRFTQLGEIGAQWSLLSAATLMVIAPLFITFLIFQRKFIQSFLHSGIK